MKNGQNRTTSINPKIYIQIGINHHQTINPHIHTRFWIKEPTFNQSQYIWDDFGFI